MSRSNFYNAQPSKSFHIVGLHRQFLRERIRCGVQIVHLILRNAEEHVSAFYLRIQFNRPGKLVLRIVNLAFAQFRHTKSQVGVGQVRRCCNCLLEEAFSIRNLALIRRRRPTLHELEYGGIGAGRGLWPRQIWNEQDDGASKMQNHHPARFQIAEVQNFLVQPRFRRTPVHAKWGGGNASR